uniref:Uncharacterized protein n=1 Tax=Moniliophthora roreri TaxID=221103 RepID=A0A0W0FL67_MONRR
MLNTKGKLYENYLKTACFL